MRENADHNNTKYEHFPPSVQVDRKISQAYVVNDKSILNLNDDQENLSDKIADL